MQSLCGSFNTVLASCYYSKTRISGNYDSARISKQYLKTYTCLVQ